MRYALKFGYNGKNYSGYARQQKQKSVESEIIKALKKSKIILNENNAKLRVASRTDKGVSAVGNVMALNTDFRQKEILPALNAHLGDVWFYGLAEVLNEFNPRHAKQRWYRYYLFNEGLDLQGVKEAAKIFIGTHDFSNFARLEGKDPTRTLDSIAVTKEKDLIILDFKAESFLWNMVRRIVKAISDVANGKLTLDEIENALSADKKIDLGIAEPEPLILMDVQYDFNFSVDKTNFKRQKMLLKEKLLDLRVEGMVYHLMLNIDE